MKFQVGDLVLWWGHIARVWAINARGNVILYEGDGMLGGRQHFIDPDVLAQHQCMWTFPGKWRRTRNGWERRRGRRPKGVLTDWYLGKIWNELIE